MPQKNENEIVAGDASIVAKPGKQFFASAALVCVVFFIWVFVYVVNINGMYPTFLQDVKGMSVFDSSMLPNWLAIITIPLGIVAGLVSDKFAIRKKALVTFYVVTALIFFFLAFTPGEDATSSWAFCIIMGVCASFIPTYTRGITPLLCTDSFKCDMALCLMAFFTGAAQVCAVFASMSVAAIGWFANAQFVLAPLCLVAAVAIAIVVKDDKKVVEIRKQEEEADRAAVA
jgi:sugar phosphate permease